MGKKNIKTKRKTERISMRMKKKKSVRGNLGEKKTAIQQKKKRNSKIQTKDVGKKVRPTFPSKF